MGDRSPYLFYCDPPAGVATLPPRYASPRSKPPARPLAPSPAPCSVRPARLAPLRVPPVRPSVRAFACAVARFRAGVLARVSGLLRAPRGRFFPFVKFTNVKPCGVFTNVYYRERSGTSRCV